MGHEDGTAAKSGRYHHGGLRAALIDATDAILAERGLEGFTLREAARRAGVSAAAPTHHFGGVAGLLTEVAIRGFDALRRELEAAAADVADPRSRLHAAAAAYVGFALSQPGRFRLMFRNDLLQAQDMHLRAAANAAQAELWAAIAGERGGAAGDAADPAVLGTWSAIHGFAMLALDGKLDHLAGPGGRAATVDALLRAMLDALWPSRRRGW